VVYSGYCGSKAKRQIDELFHCPKRKWTMRFIKKKKEDDAWTMENKDQDSG
jgi:hypothetical protein